MSSLLVFSRVYRLEIQSVMMVFSTQLSSLTFSLVQLPHPSPLPKVYVRYIQTVCVWEGVGRGVLNCVGDHIMQEFITLLLARFTTHKIASQPQTKT
jgi:hypothetical protein